jgi:hypothetical protein
MHIIYICDDVSSDPDKTLIRDAIHELKCDYVEINYKHKSQPNITDINDSINEFEDEINKKNAHKIDINTINDIPVFKSNKLLVHRAAEFILNLMLYIICLGILICLILICIIFKPINMHIRYIIYYLFFYLLYYIIYNAYIYRTYNL